MGMQNPLPSDLAAVLSTIDPDAYTANTYTGDWVKCDNFDQFLGVFCVGTMGASATVIPSIQQANTSGGGGAKAVKTATTLTQAGSDADKQVLINVRAEELDQENGFLWIAPRLVVGVQTCDAMAFILGFGSRYLAVDTDLATVDEIVN